MNTRTLLVAALFSAGLVTGCRRFELECGETYRSFRCFYRFSPSYGYRRVCRAVLSKYVCDADEATHDDGSCDGNVDCPSAEVCLSEERRCAPLPEGCTAEADCATSEDGSGNGDGDGAEDESVLPPGDTPPSADAGSEDTAASSSDGSEGTAASSSDGSDAGQQASGSSEPGGSEPANGDLSGGSVIGMEPRLEFPCETDSQCGAGLCREGECFYVCESDDQCGSGDRCAAETGTRVCLPDPNPPVNCLFTSQCESGEACFDGSCRDTCEADTDCSNVRDRCWHGICEPDRRTIVECTLNLECAAGDVCLNGQCVSWCDDPPCE